MNTWKPTVEPRRIARQVEWRPDVDTWFNVEDDGGERGKWHYFSCHFGLRVDRSLEDAQRDWPREAIAILQDKIAAIEAELSRMEKEAANHVN